LIDIDIDIDIIVYSNTSDIFVTCRRLPRSIRCRYEETASVEFRLIGELYAGPVTQWRRDPDSQPAGCHSRSHRTLRRNFQPTEKLHSAAVTYSLLD